MTKTDDIVSSAKTLCTESTFFRGGPFNEVIAAAAKEPDPKELYGCLWYEREVCLLYADTNVGKSVLAVQIAEEIARTQPVVYFDFELNEKQLQMRYTNPETGSMHKFPPTLYWQTVDRYNVDLETFQQQALIEIERMCQELHASVAVIDNLTAICGSLEKGSDAAKFMQALGNVKERAKMSLLVVCHTPKRKLDEPLTENSIAGSKHLANLADSIIGVGQSLTDSARRYVKQIKTRNSEKVYGANNVKICDLGKEGDMLRLVEVGTGKESDMLKQPADSETAQRDAQIIDYAKSGKSVREIEKLVGVSKSMVGNIVNKAKQDGLW